MVAFLESQAGSAGTPASNAGHSSDAGAVDPLSRGPLFFVVEAWLILFKQRFLLCVLLVLAAIATLLLVPKLPRSYSSAATIQLRKSLETAASEDVGLKPTEAAGQITEDYRDVQMGILGSEHLLRSVAADLLEQGRIQESSPGLRSKLRTLVLDALSKDSQEVYIDEQVLRQKRIDDVAAGLRSGLGISRGYKSPRVQLKYKHAKAAEAQHTLQMLLEHYQSQIAELYNMGPALDRAEELYQEALSQWDGAQKDLEKYRKEHGIIDLGLQTATVRADLQAAESRSLELRVAGERARARLSSLNEARDEIPASFPTAPSRVDNRASWVLYDLLRTSRERLVESPFVEGSPEFSALQGPVEELRGELEDQQLFFEHENPDLPNTSYFKLQSDLAGAAAEADSSDRGAQLWNERAETARAELARLESCSSVLASLERHFEESESARADRETHVNRLRGIDRMREAELLWSFKVIEPPTLPSGPSSPSRTLIALVLAIVGSGMALLTTLAIGAFDPSLRSPIELTHAFGVAPALCLPDFGSRSERRQLLKRMGVGFVDRLRLPRMSADGRSGIFSGLGSAGVLLDSRMDGLLRQLDEGTPTALGPRVISVSGVHQHAGASTLAINLTRHWASNRGGRVVLCIAHEAGKSPKQMAADLSRGQALLGDLDNVELRAIDLDGNSVAELQLSLEHGDLAILDVPPVLGSRAVRQTARVADAHLLVARAHQTRRAAVKESVHTLTQAGKAPVGLVFNGHRGCLPFGLDAPAA